MKVTFVINKTIASDSKFNCVEKNIASLPHRGEFVRIDDVLYTVDCVFYDYPNNSNDASVYCTLSKCIQQDKFKLDELDIKLEQKSKTKKL